MNVILAQGTWGDDDSWWRPRHAGSFAQAVLSAGHKLLNGRPFNPHLALGGIGLGNGDLRIWRGAGNHLYDRLDPPLCPACKPDNLVVIGHSHARQAIKFACQAGLTVDVVILVSGPIRKDVDRETPLARGRIGKLVCLHGGRGDYMQRLGGLFDLRLNWDRKDPQADINEGFDDANHSSLLTDPAQFHRVLRHIPKL